MNRMRPLWVLLSSLLAMTLTQKVTDTVTDEVLTIGKTTCICSLNLVVNGRNCKKDSSGGCNANCSGKARRLKLIGESGKRYNVNLMVRKGRVKVRRCKVKKTSKPTEIPTPQPTEEQTTTDEPTPKPTEITTPTPTEIPSPKPTTAQGVVISKTEIKILQTWNQEPLGYNRTAAIQVPDSTSGKKFPVVIDLHGSGGQGSLSRYGRTFKDTAILVAPSGYQRQWNINAYRSKSKTTAPDVEFIVDLIEAIRVGIPSADMDDVTIIGSSMGGGMVQRLLIEVPAPLPFHRVVPIYGMLNTNQYHDGMFWMSSDEETLPYDVPVKPANPGPEFIYFHGDQDKVVTYLGGPGIASNIFLGAQNAVYTWAQYWGETGPKLSDEEGILLDTGMVEYSYLDGKVVHYKLPGAGHSLGSYGTTVKAMIRDLVTGK